MSTIDALLLGAVGAALVLVAAYFSFLGIKKTWALANSLTEALKEIPKLREANQQLVVIGKQVGEEVMYLRQIMSASAQPEAAAYQPITQSPSRVAVPAFPTPDFSRFSIKNPPPDATIEDTDMNVLTQTDAELTEIERLENLRQMGIDVAEDEVTEGQ